MKKRKSVPENRFVYGAFFNIEFNDFIGTVNETQLVVVKRTLDNDNAYYRY